MEIKPGKKTTETESFPSQGKGRPSHVKRMASDTSSDTYDAFKDVNDRRNDSDEESSVPVESALTTSYSIGDLSSPNIEEYGIYYFGKAHRDLLVTRNTPASPSDVDDSGGGRAKSTKQPVYYADMSEFARHKPDVTLHALATTPAASTTFTRKEEISQMYRERDLESGPVVGLSHFPKFSRTFHVALGDPESSEVVAWEQLKPTHPVTHSEYQFSFQGGVSGRRRFLWRRTRDAADGVQGGKIRRRFALDNFKLLDVTGSDARVLAIFTNSHPSWRKRGGLKILSTLHHLHHNDGGEDEEGVGEGELKTMIFLTCIAILEKARRRANYRRSGGGGGG